MIKYYYYNVLIKAITAQIQFQLRLKRKNLLEKHNFPVGMCGSYRSLITNAPYQWFKSCKRLFLKSILLAFGSQCEQSGYLYVFRFQFSGQTNINYHFFLTWNFSLRYQHLFYCHGRLVLTSTILTRRNDTTRNNTVKTANKTANENLL